MRIPRPILALAAVASAAAQPFAQRGFLETGTYFYP